MQYVFILGAGRSGTKIFRDCIGASKNVVALPYDVGYVWMDGQNRPHDELLPADLSSKRIQSIRKSIASLAKRASKGQSYDIIIEKSVPNTLRPAYLKKVFPDSKFIHIVRDGRDVVESAMRNWKTPSDKGYLLDKLRYFPFRNWSYALWYLINMIRRLSKDTQVLWLSLIHI